jgi:signal transduction histidine kinase
MFFENDNISIYIYIILYEIISIILLHNTSLWYIFLSVNIFFVLIFIFVNKFKNISSDLEDKIYNINSENISYKNQHQSNSNFINQILFELEDYLKNLTLRNEYKKNIVVIRSIQKKLKERVSIINKKTSLNIEVFSIDKVISEILDNYSPIIIEKNISIYFNKFTKIDYTLNTDKNKIKEILSEVIENAINFSYENSSIIITEDKIYDKISIKIKNYSENNINTDKIYKLNYSHGKNSSTGIGLYIAKKYSQLTETKLNIYKDIMTEDIISDIDIKIMI